MMNRSTPFLTLLQPYRERVEETLQQSIAELGEKSPLRDACEYALLSGGKRFRPALVHMIAHSLGFGLDVSSAAIGIEYFHTASLIADDLPCMDNDDERRNKPATHKVFGESTALLATYVLISAGYGRLVKNGQLIAGSRHPYAHMGHALSSIALENACYNTGLAGATGGQYLDLMPIKATLPLVLEVIQKKTVTLFEICFVLGWLFGGGDPEKLKLVKQAAAHFGVAFQIADDLDDVAQDLSHNHWVNIANVIGVEASKKMFHEEINHFCRLIEALDLNNSEIFSLADLLTWQVEHQF